MSKIAWTFAKNDGGRDSGFHDAGVETFKGKLDRHLARELGQNSLDARLEPKKPVVLKFALGELERETIPGIDYLADTIGRCAKFWIHDQRAYHFFMNAQKLAKAQTISVMYVGDYNTTGVRGHDTEKTKNWYNLIRCAGASSKEGGEGGSFGIGKNAPFAASQMRTVLYSTRNKDEEYAFIGVATLVSHGLPNRGGTAQPVGFLGGKKGSSVRTEADIPSDFLRKEYGTDLYILGVPKDPDWESDLAHSVLDNFWPAIHFGDLEVQVGKVTITKDNLAPLLQEYSTKEDFTAHLYYKAFTSPTHTFEKDLPRLGKATVFLLAGDAALPKRIVMVRTTGMVIFAKAFRSVVPFCGVFLCRSDPGNNALREMEPPRHDAWDPDHPEKGANKAVEAEYVSFIREAILQMAPADASKVISIPGLSRFLPDDDDTPEEEFGGDGSDQPAEELKTEGAVPNPPLPQIPPTKIDVRKRDMEPDEMSLHEEGAETEGGTGDGSGGGPAKRGQRQERRTRGRRWWHGQRECRLRDRGGGWRQVEACHTDSISSLLPGSGGWPIRLGRASGEGAGQGRKSAGLCGR